jgi:putative FmdB family regulatory protein
MPLFDFDCRDCGIQSEVLVLAPDDTPRCQHCGSTNLIKKLALPSSLSGIAKNRVPAMNEHGCCGVSPSEAGCAGPGSCCHQMNPMS